MEYGIQNSNDFYVCLSRVQWDVWRKEVLRRKQYISSRIFITRIIGFWYYSYSSKTKMT